MKLSDIKSWNKAGNGVVSLVPSIILLLSALAVPMAAGGSIKWLQGKYDFGVFKEILGPKTGSVQFVNLGPDSVMINRVKPSCGCTGADYTHGMIAPGDTATVWFTYNPAGRPGPFSKTVRVYTGASNDLKQINITGTVIGAPASLDRDYPLQAGAIRLSGNTVDFGKIEAGHPRHDFLRGYNQADRALVPRIVNDSKALSVKLSADTIGPGDIFSVSFYLNTRLDDRMGDLVYPVTICDGDSCTVVEARACVLPPAAALTGSQLAQAPRVSLPSKSVDVDVREGRSKAKFRIPVVNDGADNLKIYRCYSEAVAVKILKMPVNLKPGKQSYVEGEVDMRKVQGPAFGYIVKIVTSDPRVPVSEVRISGQNPGYSN